MTSKSIESAETTIGRQPSLTESQAVRVTNPWPGVARAVIDNPPFNLFTPTVFAGFRLLQQYVDDPANDVRVVIIESANPDFFIAHVDFSELAIIPDIPGAANVVENWPKFAEWLSSTPALTIAKLRGRARGIGSELAISADLRFASIENTLLCQIEVGFGLLPGGGGLEWLPRHVGRARALEIILGAEDFDAKTAELYGWINRAIPDAELDAYVDRLARRVASFNPVSIAKTKQMIDQRSPTPPIGDYAESFGAILGLANTERAREIARVARGRADGNLATREFDLPVVYDPDRWAE
ncbi:enoyl-CoA hydratase/isomerase family protein [Ensifer adhaerens]|uniref:enoyl-CoA hydratase/isomerase family protein n=1 Tax=Ensifer adhaerens TaxID=106592 RepID=UPI001CC10B6F|nr:enoyl-CoA hydratase/isomerase family protein [Ensifer adhaerens]MBZ7924296.1 enoyl-CoA hydratase/isomerase family protein [Ensifer adhaerens]UAX96453.1 enoyl-CoA hydratase/isomerase family protein [Ensifer adhaerens]UAY04204.1 enoyl-CoA hydratase/isomerase family protein [Ensifer adhaerens]UAY12190.1 enoyl-CoA hydratase/isomerase family protein [Ensifer adhaerens]